MASPAPSPSTLELLAAKPKQLLPDFDVVVVNHISHNHEQVLRATMIVMACMIGMFMFLCTITIILRSCYSRRHNHNNNPRRRNAPILFDVNGVVSDDSNDEGPMMEHPIWFIRTEGLQQSLIDSITVFRYRKEEGLIDGTVCSVCLGEFEQEESLRLLPKCSHAFHIPCIDTWLRSHKNCPLCRAPVVLDAAGNGSGSGTGTHTDQVSVTEPDSNVSGQNHVENLDGTTEEGTYDVGDSEGSALRVAYDDSEGEDSEIPDKIFPDSEKVNCHALIGSQEVEVEEEIQPMRRSVSMDLNCDLESTHTHLDDKINPSSKDVIIGKQGSGSSTIYKLASIGRALQKRPISLRGSFSDNTKFIFSRHRRSQSSTLPL